MFRYEAQLAQVHEEYGKEKNHLCEGSSQLLHWCVLLYRLFTANQCHGFSTLFTNQCTLFHALQLILAWQQSVDKAVPCQTVNSFRLCTSPLNIAGETSHQQWLLAQTCTRRQSDHLHFMSKCSWRRSWEPSQSRARFTLSSSGALGQEANSDYLVQSWVSLKCQGCRGIGWCGFSVMCGSVLVWGLFVFFFKVAKQEAIWWGNSSSLITLALILSALPFVAIFSC